MDLNRKLLIMIGEILRIHYKIIIYLLSNKGIVHLKIKKINYNFIIIKQEFKDYLSFIINHRNYNI